MKIADFCKLREEEIWQSGIVTSAFNEAGWSDGQFCGSTAQSGDAANAVVVPKPFYHGRQSKTDCIPMTSVRKFMTPEIETSGNMQSGMRSLPSCQRAIKIRSAVSAFKFTAIFAALAFFLSPATAASDELDPTGFWKTEKRDGVVEIFRCGNAFCGRVSDAAILRKNPKQTDVNNPDRALRNRAIRGLVVLKNFTGGSGQWSGGPLYDPDTGDSASTGRLRLRDAKTLEVRGCIARFFCRTQVWTRRQP